MDLKLFRNFTPYVNRASLAIRLEDFEHLTGDTSVKDPNGQTWVSGGFTPFSTGEFAINVNGAGILAMVQINERILPAAVIKEKMVDRIAQIEARDQRKANKKDYAQVKEEVTGELLPKAFIKRTFIPILFVKGRGDIQHCLVFTSSAKKADDVMMSLHVLFTVWTDKASRWDPTLLANAVVKDIPSTLNGCASGESLNADGHDDPDSPAGGQYLTLGKSAVLKGKDKQRITIKEKDIGSAEVQSLLTSTNYDVAKLAMEYYDGDVDSAADVTLTDKLVFSGMKVAAVGKAKADDEAEREAETLHNVWVVARTCADMLSTVIEAMEGLREHKAAVGSHDAGAKISGGISAAQAAILNDPLQQTDLDSVFGAVVPDEEEL